MYLLCQCQDLQRLSAHHASLLSEFLVRGLTISERLSRRAQHSRTSFAVQGSSLIETTRSRRLGEMTGTYATLTAYCFAVVAHRICLSTTFREAEHGLHNGSATCPLMPPTKIVNFDASGSQREESHGRKMKKRGHMLQQLASPHSSHPPLPGSLQERVSRARHVGYAERPRSSRNGDGTGATNLFLPQELARGPWGSKKPLGLIPSRIFHCFSSPPSPCHTRNTMKPVSKARAWQRSESWPITSTVICNCSTSTTKSSTFLSQRSL